MSEKDNPKLTHIIAKGRVLAAAYAAEIEAAYLRGWIDCGNPRKQDEARIALARERRQKARSRDYDKKDTPVSVAPWGFTALK